MSRLTYTLKQAEWILYSDDEALEYRHNWVQYAFPLPDPSNYNPNAPTISKAEFHLVSDQDALLLGKFAVRFCEFILRNSRVWTPGNHNHLRITRAIKCLMLAQMPVYAKDLYLLAIIHANGSCESQRFWSDAIYEKG